MKIQTRLASCFVALAAVLAVKPAEAKIYFQPRLMYLEETDKSNSGDSTRKRTLIDAALGYGMDNGLLIGAIYATEKRQWSSSAGGASDATRTSMGPSVGWMGSDAVAPYVMGTYYLSSEYVTGSYTYKGTGFQIDLGVNFKVGPGAVGLQLSYKKFDYNKYTLSGRDFDLSPADSQGFIDPYFAFAFEF